MRLTLCLLFIAATACGPTIGDPCTTDKQCSAVCLNRPFAPGGYCTQACTLDKATCPSGTVCVKNAISGGQPGCMRTCQTAKECRDGYVCRAEQNSTSPICVGPEGI